MHSFLISMISRSLRVHAAESSCLIRSRKGLGAAVLLIMPLHYRCTPLRPTNDQHSYMHLFLFVDEHNYSISRTPSYLFQIFTIQSTNSSLPSHPKPKPNNPPVRCVHHRRSAPRSSRPSLSHRSSEDKHVITTCEQVPSQYLKLAWRVFKLSGNRQLVLRSYRSNLIWIIPAKGQSCFFDAPSYVGWTY
jgi:hypothetical protein